MKTLLLLATAALALSGCDLLNGGCPRFDSVPVREQGLEALALVALPDTVVLALVQPSQFPLGLLGPPDADPRQALQGDSVRVRGSVWTRREAPDLSARLDVRGDTVFVSLDEPLVRQACSPPPYPGEGFIGLQLPRGVVVRQSVVVPRGPVRATEARTFDLFRPLIRA